MTAPLAPTGVLVTAGFGCAQVQWKQPTSNPQITQYTVTTSPADVPPIVLVPWTSGFKPPVVVTVGGLDNAKAYTFTVTATNIDGTSPASVGVTSTPTDFGDGLMNTLSFLTGEISNDFIQRLGLNPPVMWIGPQYLSNRDDGQRIVFIPKGGPIVGGSLLGNDDYYSAGPGDPPAQPRQIWEAQEEVEMHIWGLQLPDGDSMRDTILSFAQARSIMSRSLATLHRITIGSNIATSDMFPEGRDKTTRGAAIVCRFQLKIPVVQYDKGTGEITSITPTLVFQLLAVPAAGSTESGTQVQFSGLGGQLPYSWALSTNQSGGSIDASSGLYAAGSTPGVDIITLTDALGTAATATVTVT